MAPKIDTVSLSEIAAVFDVDTDTIGLWRQAGMPQRKISGRPRFEVAACVQWRREKDKKDARDTTAPDEGKQRARKIAADADLAELKVRERRGQLVQVDEAERQVGRVVTTIRARVLAIRGRWAPRILGLETMAQATSTLDAIATDILATLSESADEILEDEPPASDEGAAA
jgi:phage terminase Nu1 subunit (DNA packaging protein)